MFFLILLLSGVMMYSIILSLFASKAIRIEQIKGRIEKTKTISRDVSDDFFENIPFIERIIKPLVDWMIESISKFLPSSNTIDNEEMQSTLSQAGIKMKTRDYNIMRFLIVILSSLLGLFYVSYSNPNVSFFKILVYMIVFGIFSYILLYYMLARRIRIRKEKMERQFPEFLDLLSVCIEAGLGFDQAIQYVCKEYKSELSDEFKIVTRDISLGSTRKEALLGLQSRCLVEQVKTFNAAIIQADEMGISLKKILNAQAHNTRHARRQKVEESVQKLPIKILFPMLFFIFPTIFTILLVPAGLSIIKTFSGTGLF